VSHDLQYQRVIAASPDIVFDAFTGRAGQEAFYETDRPGWVVVSTCDLRVGGVWAVDFGPSPDELYRHRYVFRAIERPRRLLLDMTEMRLDGSSFEVEVEFRFEARDGGTLMTMTQWGFPTGELRDEHRRGTPNAFDRFAAVVAQAEP
jgi:uncharacterized protein YndB with AHSA1/START domain